LNWASKFELWFSTSMYCASRDDKIMPFSGSQLASISDAQPYFSELQYCIVYTIILICDICEWLWRLWKTNYGRKVAQQWIPCAIMLSCCATMLNFMLSCCAMMLNFMLTDVRSILSFFTKYNVNWLVRWRYPFFL
jgi:hypothetical protein